MHLQVQWCPNTGPALKSVITNTLADQIIYSFNVCLINIMKQYGLDWRD